MIKKILIVVAVLLTAVLVLAATKADTFYVQRTVWIKGPPEKVFPLINDFHNWGSWSPWEKMDPAMKRIHSGAASGKGAVYAWEGNKDVGQGRMEITDTASPSQVTIKLDFLKPFEAHNVVDFRLAPKGEFTTVTWAMHGPNSYFAKVMQVFVSMDSMVGKDFETGLANMKAVAEK
jgi:Polyketide cyclase / dehydrase and lipid transport